MLSDLNPLPADRSYDGLEFVQCDVRAGVDLEGAARGWDLLLHLPAWHGIHSRHRPRPPRRHFGTFVDELKTLDAKGEQAVRSVRCPY